MRFGSLVLGTQRGIAGTVYGTIVVLATLTAGASAYKTDPWRLATLAGATVFVFWVAHVYSHGLGESLELGRRLNWDELVSIARREFSILLASVLPLTMIVLGALGVLRHTTAIWLAVGVGVATLGAQGLRYARLERLSTAGTIISVSVNLSIGLFIVLLKAVVAH